MEKKLKFTSKIKFFESKYNSLKEDNVKLKIIINELKKKISDLEAKKNYNVVEDNQSNLNLKENALREIYKIIKSENIEFEVAGLIGEREYYKEKIQSLEQEIKDLKKTIIKLEDDFNQKQADLIHLRNTIDSLNREKSLYKEEFEKEKTDFFNAISQKEAKLKKAFITIHLAKKKLLNEKNLLQIKLDQIMSNFINREKRLKTISETIKHKEAKLDKEYLEKERNYIKIINDNKRELNFLENKLKKSQDELKDAVVKLNKYEEDLEFLEKEEL